MDLKEYFRENEEKGLGAVRGAQREAYGWWDRLRWFEKPTIAIRLSLANCESESQRRIGGCDAYY